MREATSRTACAIAARRDTAVIGGETKALIVSARHRTCRKWLSWRSPRGRTQEHAAFRSASRLSRTRSLARDSCTCPPGRDPRHGGRAAGRIARRPARCECLGAPKRTGRGRSRLRLPASLPEYHDPWNRPVLRPGRLQSHESLRAVHWILDSNLPASGARGVPCSTQLATSALSPRYPSLCKYISEYARSRAADRNPSTSQPPASFAAGLPLPERSNSSGIA